MPKAKQPRVQSQSERAQRELDKARPSQRAMVPIRILCAMQAHCDAGRTDSEICDLINAHLALHALPDSAPPVPWPVSKVTQIVEAEHWRERTLESAEDEGKRVSAHQIQNIRWERAVTAAARYLSLRGMELAGEAADQGNARNFKDAAQGAKLFVDIARGVDGKAGDAGANAPSVSVFFINGVGVKRASQEKRVAELPDEPVIPQSVEAFD